MRHTLIAVLLYFLMGTPAATAIGFKPPVDYGVGDYPDSIAAGDFNRDGKLDLVVANYSSVVLSVLLGNGTFRPKVAPQPAAPVFSPRRHREVPGLREGYSRAFRTADSSSLRSSE